MNTCGTLEEWNPGLRSLKLCECVSLECVLLSWVFVNRPVLTKIICTNVLLGGGIDLEPRVSQNPLHVWSTWSSALRLHVRETFRSRRCTRADALTGVVWKGGSSLRVTPQSSSHLWSQTWRRAVRKCQGMFTREDDGVPARRARWALRSTPPTH